MGRISTMGYSARTTSSATSRHKCPGSGACNRDFGCGVDDRRHRHPASRKRRLKSHRRSDAVHRDQRDRRKRTTRAIESMTAKHSQLGWRIMTGLVLCGAAAGFTVPAIGSSLVQQEKREPAVRLLPAPRLPSSETQPIPSTTLPVEPVPTAPPRPLGLSRAEQREFRQFQHSYKTIKKDEPGTSAPAAPVYVPTVPTSSPPSSSSTPKKQPTAKGPKASTGSGQTGGTEAQPPSSPQSKQK